MSRRLKNKKNDKAEEILAVAFELFSKREYGDVSVKNIADQANSTYSLVYYYYRSKSELFHSCVKWALQNAISAYQELDDSNLSPVDAINMWLDLNVKQSKNLKRLCRIMLEASNRRGNAPNIDWYVRYFYKFEKTTLENSIKRGVEGGDFKCERPDEFAAFISSGIDGIFYGALTRPDFKIRKSIEILRANIWRLLECQNAAKCQTQKLSG